MQRSAERKKEYQDHARAMAMAEVYRVRQEAEAAEDERQRRALAAAERVSLRRCRDQELGVRFQRASENSSGGSMGSRLEQVGAKLTHVFGKRGEKLKVEFEQSESKNCAKIDMQASYGDRANEDADLVERSLKNGESVAANLTVTASGGHRESTWTATDPGAKDKGGASEESSDYVAYLTEPGSFVLGEATSFVTAPLTYLWGSSPPSSSSSSFRMRH